MGYLFSSESVSEGHPDKVADQISDALLDNFLALDPSSKVACETLVTTGQVVLAGEVKSNAYVDVQAVARQVINRIGYTKYEAVNDISLLEYSVREDLNKHATRVCAVIDPVKVIITNYPEGQVENMAMENNPEDSEAGTHTMPFSREIYIERDDFMENPPKKFFRMTPGNEVRLKGAYIVKCTGCKKDENGNIEEIYCEFDPDSKSGMPGSMRKVKGTLHWVSANHCIDAEVRLYDRLFNVENASEVKDRDFHELLNPNSITVVQHAKIEPFLAENAQPGKHFQFQRIGYFTPDSKDSHADKLVFNRTITLKDSWQKLNK